MLKITKELTEKLQRYFSNDYLKYIFDMVVLLESETENILCMDDLINKTKPINIARFATAFLEEGGIVVISNLKFDSLHRTLFLDFLVKDKLIDNTEQEQINYEWLDITNGKPYYELEQ